MLCHDLNEYTVACNEFGIAWRRGTIASISLVSKQPTSTSEPQTTESSTEKLSATSSVVKLNAKTNEEPTEKKRVCFECV